MTTAYTNIRVETIKSEGKAFDFWVCANRGGDRVILARVNWASGSLCHPWTETEAKCWADLFADALRLKRENDKLRQELADQGWQPIETAPKDADELLLWRADSGVFLGRWIAPCEFLTEAEIRDGNVTDPEESDWFHADYIQGGRVHDGAPTHWQPLPAPPLCATQGNSLPAVSLGGSVGRLSSEKPITAYPRIRDLPVSEREPFAAWLIGQTVPMITDSPDSEQDAYYPWDYDNWKRKGPILD
jgi:hypothetical protein